MGFIRKLDFRNPKLNKSDRKDFIDLSRRYTWCDKHIAFPYSKEIGILLTSHPGNRAFLKSSVETHSKTKLWITLAYDNYFNPDVEDISWDHLMPSKEVIDKVNCFLMSSYQKWGGVLYPYFWLLKLGLSVMKDFQYVYCANGDCVIERSEGLFEMLDLLKKEDADLIACGWWDGERPIFGSTGFIGKTKSVNRMMKHFQEHFIPFKAYEKSCMDLGNCEGRMGRAIKDLGLKIIPIENPEDEQMHNKGIGTWCEKLGFRHIHGEFNKWWKEKDKRIPPEIKYYDKKFFSGGDLEAVTKWWEQHPEK